jgi:uncharacterized protein with GYD domain
VWQAARRNPPGSENPESCDHSSKTGLMTQIYWTLGQYDLVAIIEATDEASATAFALAISSAGNVRMQTLHAFSKDEMSRILAKMG